MVKLNKKGFTLAELLIVVAVIAVLVAVAIPTFNNQLEKSRQAVDISNLRGAYAAARLAEIDQQVENTAIADGDAFWYNPDTGGLVKATAGAAFADPITAYGKALSSTVYGDTSGLKTSIVTYTTPTSTKAILVTFKSGSDSHIDIDKIQFAATAEAAASAGTLTVTASDVSIASGATSGTITLTVKDSENADVTGFTANVTKIEESGSDVTDSISTKPTITSGSLSKGDLVGGKTYTLTITVTKGSDTGTATCTVTVEA